MDRKEELVQQITKAADAYYLHEPVMSDQQFDALVDELRSIDPDATILHQVGWGIKIYGEKVKLPIPIQESLPKIKSVADVEKINLVAPKIDGKSCLLMYENGKLVMATNRGDGQYGIDHTRKCHKIDDIPKEIPEKRTCVVRGEWYIKKSTFAKEFQLWYANPRNTVSGVLNTKSFENLEHVSFTAFDISYIEDDKVTTLVGYPAFSALVVNYISTPLALCTTNPSDKELKEIYMNLLENSDYPVDGLVLDGVVAWKCETMTVDAEVGYVDWKMSPKFRLIPCIVLKNPVSLYGTQVTRASAFNYAFVDNYKLGPGAVVRITKANEIIPYIVQVIKPADNYEDLKVCPDCKSILTKDANETHLVCKGGCNNQMKESLKCFIETHLIPKGVANVKVITESLIIRNPADLYYCLTHLDYSYKTLEPVMGPSRAKLLFDHWKRPLQIDVRKFIESLGLPNVGWEFSCVVAPYLDSLVKGFLLPEDVKINRNAREAINDNIELIKGFYYYFEKNLYIPETRTYTSKVCVTGRLSMTRSKFEDKLNDAGIQTIDFVDKDTILITNDTSSNSSKMKKARELGIEVISEEEAIKRWLK